ncbi:hypothetical protein Pelo_18869 [Pelomyxa schiedti]|nr:hypothetical protein Pelo_18869 [Pelomyxa schiedti]
MLNQLPTSLLIVPLRLRGPQQTLLSLNATVAENEAAPTKILTALVRPRKQCHIKSASVYHHVCTRSCIQTVSLRSTNEADMGSKLTYSAAQKLVEAIYTGRFPTSLSYSEFLLLKQFLTEAGAACILPELSDAFTSCILLTLDPVEAILEFHCPYFATLHERTQTTIELRGYHANTLKSSSFPAHLEINVQQGT